MFCAHQIKELCRSLVRFQTILLVFVVSSNPLLAILGNPSLDYPPRYLYETPVVYLSFIRTQSVWVRLKAASCKRLHRVISLVIISGQPTAPSLFFGHLSEQLFSGGTGILRGNCEAHVRFGGVNKELQVKVMGEQAQTGRGKERERVTQHQPPPLV